MKKELIFTSIILTIITAVGVHQWQSHRVKRPKIMQKLTQDNVRTYEMKEFKNDQVYIEDIEKHYGISSKNQEILTDFVHPEDLREYQRILVEFKRKYSIPFALRGETGKTVIINTTLPALLQAQRKLQVVRNPTI